jgi:hypothetical protein
MLAMLIFKKLTINTSEIMTVEPPNIQFAFNEVKEKMIQVINTHFSDNFLATLFKNKSKCDQLDAEIAKMD